MAFNNHFAEQQFLGLRVRNGSRGDIAAALIYFRFTPESRH